MAESEIVPHDAGSQGLITGKRLLTRESISELASGTDDLTIVRMINGKPSPKCNMA